MASGISRAGLTDLFNGQSDIVIFNPISDYKGAHVGAFKGAQSLGQIVQDSTEWTGDDPEVENLLDEQGEVITASVSAGTMGFSFQMADTSPDNFGEFLKGTEIWGEYAAKGDSAWSEVSKVVGFGYQLPTMTRPIMVVNDEMNKSLLFPKAKITSNLTLEDGLWRIAVNVVAETVDTGPLKTGMMIVGKTAYKEQVEAFKDDLSAGGEVILSSSFTTPVSFDVSKPAEINLNGHTISSTASGAVLKFSGEGESTITGGTVIGASGKDANAIRVEEGATLTISGGRYSVGKDANGEGNSCIYSTGGTIKITGGIFSSEGTYKEKHWVLNKKDGTEGKIEVSGGRFKDFDPGNPGTELGETSFLADGYKSVSGDDGYYEVVPNTGT